MDIKHIRTVLRNTVKNMGNKPITTLVSEIASNTKNLKSVSLEDQYMLGAALGSLLHKSYCDGRRRAEPAPDGLPNEPRIKELDQQLDQEFKLWVLEGRIPTDKTLYVQEGKVYMDIANRDFSQLSPYWQYDNFMAGCCAARSVLTNWEGLTHGNEEVRKYTVVAVANGIHESWIARGNVGDWNANLATAYVNLPVDEQDKDLGHYKMATDLIESLSQEIEQNNSSDDDLPV